MQTAAWQGDEFVGSFGCPIVIATEVADVLEGK
jgi:hypothetical protein